MCEPTLLLAVMLLGAAQSAQPTSTPAAAVRAVIEREIVAWNQFDAGGVAALYTETAIWQNPFGVRIHGRENLQKFLTTLFKRDGYRSAKTTMAPVISDLRLLTTDVAVVWGEEKSEGQVDDRTGKPMEPRHSRWLEVLIKTPAGWRISECMILDQIKP